jgi:hypothetical protein
MPSSMSFSISASTCRARAHGTCARRRRGWRDGKRHHGARLATSATARRCRCLRLGWFVPAGSATVEYAAMTRPSPKELDSGEPREMSADGPSWSIMRAPPSSTPRRTFPSPSTTPSTRESPSSFCGTAASRGDRAESMVPANLARFTVFAAALVVTYPARRPSRATNSSKLGAELGQGDSALGRALNPSRDRCLGRPGRQSSTKRPHQGDDDAAQAGCAMIMSYRACPARTTAPAQAKR